MHQPSLVHFPLAFHGSPVLLARDAIQRIAQALAEPPTELRARETFVHQPSLVHFPLAFHGSPVLLARDAIQRIAQALAEPPTELRAH